MPTGSRTTTLLFVAFFLVRAAAAQDYAAKVLSVHPSDGYVELFDGSVRKAAKPGDLLPVGGSLCTGRYSRAVLILADKPGRADELTFTEGEEIKLDANSEMSIHSPQSDFSRVLELIVGRLWGRTRRRPGSLWIGTRAGNVAISGSEFNIQFVGDEIVVTLLEGHAELRNDGGSQIPTTQPSPDSLHLTPDMPQGSLRSGQRTVATADVRPEDVRDTVQWTFFYSPTLNPRDLPFELTGPADDAVEQSKSLFNQGRLEEAQQRLGPTPGPQAAQVRGWIYLAQGLNQQALTAFQQAPRQDPRTKVGQAIAELSFGAADGALKLLIEVPSQVPAYALAQSLLADALLVQGRTQGAAKASQRALAASPDLPSALLAASHVSQAGRDLPQALRLAERALESDPDFIPAQLQRATLLFGLGRRHQAETAVGQVLLKDADNALAQALLGFVFLAQGRTDRARDAFERSRRGDSTLSVPLMGIGLVEMREGRTDSATEAFWAAAALDPALANYQSYLGKALYESRDFERAQAALDQAKQLDPQDPTPYLYAGIMWEDLNNPGRSVRELENSIERNDNRAVYRGSFLLDEDRATRNVRLADSYRILGLDEWANFHAVRSNLDDYANASAHLFLGDTFLNLPGRTLAAGSELLWGRLLQPANVNTFNSFNSYTTFFERPRIDLTLAGLYGSRDTAGGSALVSGGMRRLAYRAFFTFDRTAGFRQVNDQEEAHTAIGLLKYGLTPNSTLTLSFSHQQTDQGDPAAGPLVSQRNDPNLKVFTRQGRFEIGYHHRLRPGSDLVVAFSGRSVDQVIQDPDFLTRTILGQESFDIGISRSILEPNLQLQAAHVLKLESLPKLQLRYGFDIFEGRRRVRDIIHFIFPSDPPQEVVGEQQLVRETARSKTVFAHADYELHDRLSLAAGINYDWFKRQDSSSQWNPQGGFSFRPIKGTQLRFAAIRHLQSHSQETVVPAHIQGFPVRLNEAEAIDSTALNLAWDQRWRARSFLRAAVFRRFREIPFSPAPGDPSVDTEGDLYGGEVIWNQFLTDRLTFVPRYALTHSDDIFSLRHQHEVDLKAVYAHPIGLVLEAEQQYFDQSGRPAGGLPLETQVWTTNLRASYEFPGKRGEVTFRIQNLFDSRFSFLADPLALEERPIVRTFDIRLSLNF